MKRVACAMVGVLLCAGGASAATIVDNFTGAIQSATACAPPFGPGTTSGPAPATGTISGERTINAQVAALLNTSSGCSQAEVTGGYLQITNYPGTFGRTTLTWDIAGAVNLTGSSSVSLDIGASGGLAPNDTSIFTLSFCSDNACANSFSRQWSLTGAFALSNYTFFLNGFMSSGTPSWANVTKASLVVDSGDSTDIMVDNIQLNGASVPEPSSLMLLGSALVGLGAIRRRR